ncbi:hypothetical protein BGX29_000080, partial [Mortierella sp. GBA35]
MSATTTLLAWLIPVLLIVIAFIAWRVYVYKTQGPFLPESLRERNIFARTRSMIPKTLSFTSNKDVPDVATTTMAPAGAIRNETRIDIPPAMAESARPPMASVASQSFAAVPCDRTTTTTPESISSGQQQPAPVSPAISRIIAM